MAETTGISWADATWNPHYGCRKVSQGCAKCYAERDMTRYGRLFTEIRRASQASFNAPLRWAKTGKVKPGARIFTCSWSDWFIEEADEWRDEAWAIIRQTPQYDYLILTKRPERIAAHLPGDWGDGWPNVWLGVSAEDQANADKRIPILLSVPAAVRFVSAEPLLGPIDFWKFSKTEAGFGSEMDHRGTWGFYQVIGWPKGSVEVAPGLHWVITGGESDPRNPRPCDLDWVRSIRDQCLDACVPIFHKQHGGSKKVDGAWGGRVLDGRTWDEFPVRE